MVTRSNSVVLNRVQGLILMILAVPMIGFPLINDGNPFIAVAGVAFVLFGIAAFRRNRG